MFSMLWKIKGILPLLLLLYISNNNLAAHYHSNLQEERRILKQSLRKKKKVLIVVQFFSPTSPLPSLLFFVCHSNDELSMHRSPSCKLSDLSCSDAFEPCRLLMRSNKSFFFLYRGVLHTRSPLRT